MNRSASTRLFHGLLAFSLALTFNPDPASTRILELVEQETDASLRYTHELVISPDGRYVYVGESNGSLRFTRDADTGRLSFVEAGYGAASMAISPDGRTFYSSRGYGSVRTHLRSIDSGRATLVEEWSGALALGSAGGARKVRLSPDGAHAYVILADGLAVFARNPGNSVLTWVETLYNGVNTVGDFVPVDLAFSPDGRHVYVTADSLDGIAGVTVFSRNTTSGVLTWSQRLAQDTIADLRDADEIRVSRDGQNVYLVSAEGVVALRRNVQDGTLSFLGTDGGFGTATLTLGPEDRLIYVFVRDDVDIYERQAGTGALSKVGGFHLPMFGFVGVDKAKFSPDGRFLYMTSRYSSGGGLEVFARDPSSGSLTLVESFVNDLDGDADRIDGLRSVVVSPDGRHLYGAAEDLDLEIAAFSRSPVNGSLQYLDSYSAWDDGFGYRFATHLAFSPDGRSLYASTRRANDSALAIFDRDEASGELTLVETYPVGVLGLAATPAVAVSPDGLQVYAAGGQGDLLVAFHRDPETGRLTHRQSLTGSTAFEFADRITLDAEGRHVYVASRFNQNFLAVLKRDADGELTLLEDHLLNGLGASSGIEISPDGRHLYIGSERLSVLSRDTESGRLTFVEQVGPSFGGPRVSPDGRFVFAFGDQASVYGRDPSTGGLTLIETREVVRFNSGQGSALSPEGDFAYVGASFSRDHSIHVYRIEEGPCRVGWNGLCLGDDRFRVELDWRDFEGNTGTAYPSTNSLDDSGILWFFDADNWEMQLKVLDGCDLNDRFWVFAAATTSVEYTLRITDAVTGVSKSYFNPLGQAAPTITDTDAFETCGSGSTVTSTTGAPSIVAPKIAPAVNALGSSVVRRESQKVVPAQKSSDLGLIQGLGGKCLDVEGGDPVAGSPVILYDCHLGDNQLWWRTEYCPYNCTEQFELRVFEDLCLQPGADTGLSYRPLEVGPCHGGESRWRFGGHFPQEFSLRHVDTDQCLDVLGASTDNRTPIVLYDCHEGPNQLWSYDELTCLPSPTRGCKNGDRFLVEVDWRDAEGNVGRGRLVPQDSDDSGLYWFFNPDNVEMLVKVLDGCAINQHHWVFAAATTDVEYILKVTDTQTREVREYLNTLGNTAPAITDSLAFSCTEP